MALDVHLICQSTFLRARPDRRQRNQAPRPTRPTTNINTNNTQATSASDLVTRNSKLGGGALRNSRSTEHSCKATGDKLSTGRLRRSSNEKIVLVKRESGDIREHHCWLPDRNNTVATMNLSANCPCIPVNFQEAEVQALLDEKLG